MLSTEELTSTLTEALFHYREVLALREDERGNDLPRKGKLPATADDDVLEHVHKSQLEAITKLLGSVEDMIGVAAKVNEKQKEKEVPRIEPAPQAPEKPKSFYNPPVTYEEDKPFYNPFSGKFVEPITPFTPGPSTREGPLRDPPMDYVVYWENQIANQRPRRNSDPIARKKTQNQHPAPPDRLGRYTQKPDYRNGNGKGQKTLVLRDNSNTTPWRNNGNRPQSRLLSNPQPETRGSGGYTVLPVDVSGPSVFRQQDIPTEPVSVLSRATSRIIKATNPFNISSWIRPNFNTALQSEDSHSKSQNELEPTNFSWPKPTTLAPAGITVSTHLEPASGFYADEKTEETGGDGDSGFYIKTQGGKKNKRRRGKGQKNQQMATVPEKQKVNHGTETTAKLPLPTMPDTGIPETKEPLKDFQRTMGTPPFNKPPVTANPPQSASGSGSGTSLEALWWEVPEGAQRPNIDLNGNFNGPSAADKEQWHTPKERKSEAPEKIGPEPSISIPLQSELKDFLHSIQEMHEHPKKDEGTTELPKNDPPPDPIIPKQETPQPAKETIPIEPKPEPKIDPVLQKQNEQMERDGALAEVLAVFEADFQTPADLFDGDILDSKNYISQLEQFQRDRELAERLAMDYEPGFDPETMALVAMLADDAPQDYEELLEQEIATERLIAELSGGTCQDFDTMLGIRKRDKELAKQLAEDTIQDPCEYLRQIEEQAEYARETQKAWDADVKKRLKEEAKRLAEEARLEEIRRIKEEEERRRKERMATCLVCGEEDEKINMAILSCTHPYCRVCIRDGFSIAAKERRPFRCCTQVPIAPISRHFDREFVNEYNLLIAEITSTNPLYCAVKSCSKFVPPANIKGDIGTCRVCSHATCRHCKQSQHTGICAADTESAVVRELARTKGWKPCPGCQHMIERSDGCLHMTCIKCSAEFCYSCGQRSATCPGTCKR